jgi:hypothetical protein
MKKKKYLNSLNSIKKALKKINIINYKKYYSLIDYLMKYLIKGK